MLFKKLFLKTSIFFIALFITCGCSNNTNTTELWLVRHAQTDWNVKKQITPYLPNTPLNATGEKQAEATGNYLLHAHQQKPFAAVYSSDFTRAHQTAQAIEHNLGLPINHDQRLREGDRSIETKEQVTKRTIQALQEIVKKHQGKRIIIVTHGGCLNKISHWIKNNFQKQATSHVNPDNASINIISIANNNWKIEHWNQISHLKKLNHHDRDLAISPQNSTV